MLQSMGSQRVGHDLMTENIICNKIFINYSPLNGFIPCLVQYILIHYLFSML